MTAATFLEFISPEEIPNLTNKFRSATCVNPVPFVSPVLLRPTTRPNPKSSLSLASIILLTSLRRTGTETTKELVKKRIHNSGAMILFILKQPIKHFCHHSRRLLRTNNTFSINTYLSFCNLI